MAKLKLGKSKILLILICALFLFTRLYKISEIPASLYWDEASIGYNAYSILKTGKDEWGESLPLHLRAFGEFKLPVYVYSVVLSIALFGLNEFSVRLPAVLYSLGVVVLTYLLAKRLSNSEVVGLLSAFFVSVSSWFFILSRTGYEATAGLAFYLLGIYLFLGLKKRPWNILFSIGAFILSAYSYNSFRVIIPLTILTLLIYDFKNLAKTVKMAILPILLSAILVAISIVPLYRLFVYDAGTSRLEAVSSKPSLFITNYLSHFKADFLLFTGDKNLRSQQDSFGQLYLPEVLLAVFGLIYICRNIKSGILSLVLLLLSPIPAAITKESPHALRTISFVPFISIICGFGVMLLLKWIKKEKIVYGAVIITFLIFFTNYFFNFLNVYTSASSKDWQYGYKKIFTYFSGDFQKYENVIISDEYGQPYIFALFYSKFNPNEFRETVVRNNINDWGFSTVSSFNKFKFGKINKLMENSKNSLIFASFNEKLSGLEPVDTIKFLNGEVAFWVYKQI